MEMRRVTPHEEMEPVMFYLCDPAVETPEGHSCVVAGPFKTKEEVIEAKAQRGLTRPLKMEMMLG